jgi:hypothetical protein
VSNRWMVALVLIAAAPAAAAAQFTTFIAPPNPIKDSVKAVVVAEQKSLSDSITHAQITDMKTWVDSAAGIAAIPAIDTALAVRSTTTQTTTAVSNGVVAPATASPLPFLLVIGGSAMLFGLALLRRPQLKPRRADR